MPYMAGPRNCYGLSGRGSLPMNIIPQSNGLRGLVAASLAGRLVAPCRAGYGGASLWLHVANLSAGQSAKLHCFCLHALSHLWGALLITVSRAVSLKVSRLHCWRRAGEPSRTSRNADRGTSVGILGARAKGQNKREGNYPHEYSFPSDEHCIMTEASAGVPCSSGFRSAQWCRSTTFDERNRGGAGRPAQDRQADPAPARRQG